MLETIINKLTKVGFNQLEAEVYIALLKGVPMTAYKVGKILNKPTANIYKAVDVLKSRGAVIIENGKSTLCRAVAPEQLSKVLKLKFESSLDDVNKSLAGHKPQYTDDRTYSIDSLELVYEKARKMIDKSKEFIVLDSFPVPFQVLKENILKASKRGVKIYAFFYSGEKLKGINTVYHPDQEKAMSHWKSQQLNIAVDGLESLVALFDPTSHQIYQAIWSQNVYLSCVLHGTLMSQHTVAQFLSVKDSPAKISDFDNILKEHKFFFNTYVPGFEILRGEYLDKPKSD